MNSTSIERVKPEVRDGIEFYVSADRSVAGCSQSGIAKLAGVKQQALSKLISAYCLKQPTTKSGANRLEALLHQPYYLQLVGTKGALILREEVCVALLEYYAFQSPVKNETALYSYRKFAAMGWHNWVLQVCGCDEVPTVQPGMDVVLGELQELKGAVYQLANIHKTAKESHPGLVPLMEGYARSSPVVPRGLPNPFLYAEWAVICGYPVDDHYLMNRIAEHVKALRGVRELKKMDGRNAYFYADLPAFESAIRILAEESARKQIRPAEDGERALIEEWDVKATVGKFG